MSSLEQLSQLIQQQRDEQGLSRKTLGQLLRIRPSLIESFEQEINQNMSVYHYNHLRRLCDLLSISLDPYRENFKKFQTDSSPLKQMPQISLEEKTHRGKMFYLLLTVFTVTVAFGIKLYMTPSPVQTTPENNEMLTAQITEPKPIHHHHTVLDS